MRTMSRSCTKRCWRRAEKLSREGWSLLRSALCARPRLRCIPTLLLPNNCFYQSHELFICVGLAACATNVLVMALSHMLLNSWHARHNPQSTKAPHVNLMEVNSSICRALSGVCLASAVDHLHLA